MTSYMDKKRHEMFRSNVGDHEKVDDRDRRKRRSRSRSDSRERKKNRDMKGKSSFQTTPKSFYENDNSVAKVNVSPTIIIKGLPSHTTEPTLYAVLAPYSPKEIRLIAQRDGECKGYAFVEFASLEHAQYFMMTFAGSSGGDHNAPQFIVDNRAVQLEYSREKERPTDGSRYQGSRDRDGKKSFARSDWLCDACSCHNFAKRDICFRCSASRTEHCASVSSSNPMSDSESVVTSDIPSVYLIVRGFALHVGEAQIMEVFRQFAVVKSVALMRDPSANYTKGLAFLEFHTVEHATYVLQNAGNIRIEAIPLKISYAKVNVMHQLIQQSAVPGSPLSMQIAPVADAGQWAQYYAMQQQQQQLSYSGYDASASASSTASNSSMDMLAAMYGGHMPSHQQQQQFYAGYNTQIPTAAIPSTTAAVPAVSDIVSKPTIRYPPHFETHGGGYVFQAKSGCFLEPLSEHYYCPRSKLYYSAKDGLYYSYDASQDPPFKRFEPSAPIEPDTDESVSTVADGMPSGITASVAPAVATSAQSMKPITLLSGLNATKTAKNVVSLTMTSKKLKNDLLKWNTLQLEDEEEEQQTTRGGKILRAVTSATSSTKVTTPAPSTAAVATGSFLTNVEMSLISQSSSANVVVKPAESEVIQSTVPPPLPPRPVPPPISTPTTVQAANIAATIAPTFSTTEVPLSTNNTVCLLCRRQFASLDMLQRHERESKLHADNLKQSLIDQAAAASAVVDTSSSVSSIPSLSVTSNAPVEVVSSSLSQPSQPPQPTYRNRALERRLENQDSNAGVDLSLLRPRELANREDSYHQTRDDRGRSGANSSGSGGGQSRGGGCAPSIVPAVTSTTPPKAVFEDSGNVGNTLLRKMGWTDGEGLGRDGAGREVAIGVELAQSSSKGAMHAAAGVPSSVFQYSGGGNYKESLLSAARARYEQIAKK